MPRKLGGGNMDWEKISATPLLPSIHRGKCEPSKRESANEHLAEDGRAASLARLEMGLLRAHAALASWVAELNRRVSGISLALQDIVLLHSVRLRGGTPTLAEMLVFLHRHDLASLQYSFRKLEKHGLVERMRGASKRESAYRITEFGRTVTEGYSQLRFEVLVPALTFLGGTSEEIHHAATVMERLIALYDQGAQTLMNQDLLRPHVPPST